MICAHAGKLAWAFPFGAQITLTAQIIEFPKAGDGGKSRIKARRERLALAAAAIMAGVNADDLTMDHADPGACGFGHSMEDQPG